MRTAVTNRTHLTSRIGKSTESTSVCELEKYKKATTMVDNPLYPNKSRKGYTIEESYNRGLDRLSELYGTDFRKL